MRLRKGGTAVRAISERLKCDITTVYNILSAEGVTGFRSDKETLERQRMEWWARALP